MPKQNKHPEREIQNTILQYLKWRKDLIAFEVDNQGRWDRKRRVFLKRGVNAGALFYSGISDIICLHKELGFIAFEVKAPTGRLSEFQEDFRAAVTRMGGRFAMVKSSQDVEACLNRWLAEKHNVKKTLETQVEAVLP